jgi:hypothetical protein
MDRSVRANIIDGIGVSMRSWILSNLHTNILIMFNSIQQLIGRSMPATLAAALLFIMSTNSLNAQTGPNYAGTVVNDASAGSFAWTNPSDASGSVDDDVRAMTPNLGNGDQSNFLVATDFGFSIPVLHQIDGIEITFEGQRTAGNIQDLEVFLVVGGVIQTGDNQASGGNIPVGPTDGNMTYGGVNFGVRR